MITYILDVLSILLLLCILPTAWLIYKKKLNFFSGVFLGTFLFLMSFGCSVYGTSMTYGYSPIDVIVNNAFAEIAAVYNSVPGISAAELNEMNQILAYLKNMYFMLMPCIVVLSSLAYVYIILMIAKGVLALFGKEVSGFARFCDLKMPKSALFLAVICYLFSMFLGEHQLGYAFMNFTSIIFIVCSVCGLSFLDFLLRKKLRFSVLRALIYIVSIFTLTVITGMGATMLVFVGMVDSVFDFRRIKVKTDENQ